jgi:hypothetical protein
MEPQMNANERRLRISNLKFQIGNFNLCVSAFICGSIFLFVSASSAAEFIGQHFAGSGDTEYLHLLDIAARQFTPDPEFQNLTMLYEPSWNGLVEGPTWDAWWIQNSYGGTYCWLPFAVEPWSTFIANSQELWFAHQGDGKTPDKNGYVAPDGCLVDAANLKVHYYRQGDGRHDIHDWFMEATAAGVVLQSELLLISRDEKAIDKYLPQLERAANFIETRRDPKTGLYLGGVACNLLAPSFGGYKKADGTRDKAFHAGLQVTYIAALDRLIELEKFAGHAETAGAYAHRRDLAKESLPKLVSDEGYFLNSLDPDGVEHGHFGAKQHGYFESSVNHDAICFRVADDEQAKKIYTKIASIPQLRPHDVIIPNYPSYDDLYEINWHLWQYGLWTNGGHWSTCEARMIMGYYRLGHQDDARKAFQHMLTFAKRFKMDNNLTDFGNACYQPQLPINCTYDAFAPSAAMIRGLFEYLYKADRLILVPHIPRGIARLEQKVPIRFGNKRLYLSTTGSGHVSTVTINGETWTDFTPEQVNLPFDKTPDKATIEIKLGYDKVPPLAVATSTPADDDLQVSQKMERTLNEMRKFQREMIKAGLGNRYETAHAHLIEQAILAVARRDKMMEDGRLHPLADPKSAEAAIKAYDDAVEKLTSGFQLVMDRYRKSADPVEQQIIGILGGGTGY